MNILKTLRKPYLSIFLACLMFFISCNDKTENQEPENIPLGLQEMRRTGMTVQNIGKYHNEALSIFMKNKPNYEYSNFNNLIEDINIEFKQMVPNNTFHKMTDYNISLPKSILSKFSKSPNSSFNELMLNVFKNQTTEKVETLLNKILINKSNYEDAKKIINDFIVENELSNIELEMINLFKTVAQYSNEYWSNFSESNLESKNLYSRRCDPRHQQYFGDAVGALIFGGLGAVGMSWFVYWGQQQQQRYIYFSYI